MAHVVRKETFYSAIMAMHKEGVKDHLRTLAERFPKDYAIFNPEIYVTSNLEYEYPEDTITIGVKADGIFVGSDWDYWKLLTKRLLKSWLR